MPSHYHNTPSPGNWRYLLWEIDDHILMLRQYARIPPRTEAGKRRFQERLEEYRLALRYRYEIESTTGWSYTPANPEQIFY